MHSPMQHTPFLERKNKLSYAIKQEISKIVIVALEYKIDLSRLNVIELDNSKKINEVISIVRIERDNSRYH
jgi:hypothetical protein